MFWPTLILLAIECATVSALSTAYVDASTGITFQRVQTSSDGSSSVALSLPPKSRGAASASSDAIIQLSGPVSQTFAGVSSSSDFINALAICCWCCSENGDQRRNIHRGFRKPQFTTRNLIGETSLINAHKTTTQPIFTQIAEPVITEDTFTVTFRCQNCNFSESGDGKLATLTTFSSYKEITSIMDPALTFDPATDEMHSAEFDVEASRFEGYWSVIGDL